MSWLFRKWLGKGSKARCKANRSTQCSRGPAAEDAAHTAEPTLDDPMDCTVAERATHMAAEEAAAHGAARSTGTAARPTVVNTIFSLSEEEFNRMASKSFEDFEKALSKQQSSNGYPDKKHDNERALTMLLQALISSPGHWILQVKRWSYASLARENGWPSTFSEANDCCICGVDSYWDPKSKQNVKPTYILLVEKFVGEVNSLLRRRYGDCSSLTIIADPSRYSRETISADKLKPEVLGFPLWIKTKDGKILRNTDEEDRQKMSREFLFYDQDNIRRSEKAIAQHRANTATVNNICDSITSGTITSAKELVALIRNGDLRFTVHPCIRLTDPEKFVVKSCFKDTSADVAIINSAADKLWDHFHTKSQNVDQTIGKKRKSDEKSDEMFNPWSLAQNQIYAIWYIDETDETDETVGENDDVKEGFVLITRLTKCTQQSDLRTAEVSYRWFDVDELQYDTRIPCKTIRRLEFCDLVVAHHPDLTERYKSKLDVERVVSRRTKIMKID